MDPWERPVLVGGMKGLLRGRRKEEGGRTNSVRPLLPPPFFPRAAAAAAAAMDRTKRIRKTIVMTLKPGKEEEYRASHNEVGGRRRTRARAVLKRRRGRDKLRALRLRVLSGPARSLAAAEYAPASARTPRGFLRGERQVSRRLPQIHYPLKLSSPPTPFLSLPSTPILPPFAGLLARDGADAQGPRGPQLLHQPPS